MCYQGVVPETEANPLKLKVVFSLKIPLSLKMQICSFIAYFMNFIGKMFHLLMVKIMKYFLNSRKKTI